ncbi:MAG TPA: hypothetical protein PLY91_00575 [Methanoregulaceae archaeon]|nr:hypothetical protein [Methanoregulaceae archaeon]
MPGGACLGPPVAIGHPEDDSIVIVADHEHAVREECRAGRPAEDAVLVEKEAREIVYVPFGLARLKKRGRTTPWPVGGFRFREPCRVTNTSPQ